MDTLFSLFMYINLYIWSNLLQLKQRIKEMYSILCMWYQLYQQVIYETMLAQLQCCNVLSATVIVRPLFKRAILYFTALSSNFIF